ncbi:unnamed protein product [Colias eurytheme]|nr:unnamed protein product [Colias eurytheme]
MNGEYSFNPVRLIEEVKKRPGLYQSHHTLDRDEKLVLWKEIGAALFPNWDSFDKATAYDRVLQLQKKWRSLRDAYNRELRSRRSGVRIHRRVYMYFKRMSFLGGFDGDVSDETDEPEDITREEIIMDDADEDTPKIEPADTPVVIPTPKTRKRRRVKKPSSEFAPTEEVEMPIFPLEMSEDGDSDRLFLLSFLPEMKQFPLDIKMWVRAQIANIMQEAVTTHFNKLEAGTSHDRRFQVKRQNRDSFD